MKFLLYIYLLLNKRIFMEIKDLKTNILNYCEGLNLPKTVEELTKFKNLFEYKWNQEIKSINIVDILTLKEYKYNVDYHTFSIEFHENETLYEDDNTIRITKKFSCIDYNLFETIRDLNENDKIRICCDVKSISILNRRIHEDNSLLISIHFNLISFELVEKYNHELEFEKLENSFKKTQITNSNYSNIAKSFDNLLDILLELDDLKYKSSELKTDLNNFQNEVFNKKNLEEFNLKKGVINYYNNLEFKTICEIYFISKDNIKFKLNYKNKTFWITSKKYNPELQKITFFLKEKSSVEIDFKINSIHDTFNSIDVELVTIQKNYKVKLFGRFIKLEVYWFGIYIFLFILSIITLSKVNFYGITPFLFKLTLWVFIGYVINKLGVKYFYKN